MNAVNLLNDDGTASAATAILLSHRGFRRDAARFTQAAAALRAGDAERTVQLQEAWAALDAKLHGHHHAEDERIHPALRPDPAFGAVLDQCVEDHQRLSRRMSEMTRSVARLPGDAGVRMLRNATQGLTDVLLPHLQLEDDKMIPLLRGGAMTREDAAQIPREEYPLIIDGIAWCSEGVEPEIGLS